LRFDSSTSSGGNLLPFTVLFSSVITRMAVGIRSLMFLLLPILLVLVVVVVLALKAKEISGRSETFPLGILVVMLTISTMAINVLRSLTPDFDKVERRKFLDACIDLFLASILTALATLLVWTASFPELAVAPALMAAGLYVLHWLLLTAALFLFLFGICVILGVLRRMRCS